MVTQNCDYIVKALIVELYSVNLGYTFVRIYSVVDLINILWDGTPSFHTATRLFCLYAIIFVIDRGKNHVNLRKVLNAMADIG